MLIISVTEQSGKFHYVYQDMTAVLLVNVYCSSVSWHMNHGLTLIVSFTLSRLVSRNLGRWIWARTLRVYKVFTKTGQGPWLRGDSALGLQCNKLHSTLCIVLLSEFVSRNAWLQQLKLKFHSILSKYSVLVIYPPWSMWFLSIQSFSSFENFLLLNVPLSLLKLPLSRCWAQRPN